MIASPYLIGLRGDHKVPTKTRIYTVRNPAGSIVNLVRGASPAQVGAHMARRTFRVAVASQDDLVTAMGDSIAVEDARDEPGAE